MWWLGYAFFPTNINRKHAFRIGLDSHVGELNNNAKVTKIDIPVIRERSENGETYMAIAEDYGVHEETIGQIVRKESWAHIKGELINGLVQYGDARGV